MMTLYRGDDTGGTFGKTLTLTINTDKEIYSATVYFELCGIRREFKNIVNGSSVTISFSHNDTLRMPVGTHKAVLWLVDASGKIRTINNAIPVRVTQNVGEAYDGDDSTTVNIKRAVAWSRITGAPNFVQTINSTEPDSDGNFKLNPIAIKGIDLSDITDWTESTTNKERRMSFNKLLAALRSAIASLLVILLPLFAFSSDIVTTASEGDLSEESTVVTGVTIDHASAINDTVTAPFLTSVGGVTSNALVRALDKKLDGEIVTFNGTKTYHTGNTLCYLDLSIRYTNGWFYGWSAKVFNQLATTNITIKESRQDWNYFSVSHEAPSIYRGKTGTHFEISVVTDPDTLSKYQKSNPYGVILVRAAADRYILYDDTNYDPIPLFIGSAKSAPSIVSNVVTKAYVESLGIEAGVKANAVTNIAASVTSNVVTKSYVEGLGISSSGVVKSVNTTITPDAAGNITLTAASVSAYPAASGQTLATTVGNWESYWGGSNVCWEVTNYYGQVDIPKLRLKELITDGSTNYYREVWNDITKFDIFTTNLLDSVSKTNEQCKAQLIGYIDTGLAEKAPLAWGKYTDCGSPNTVSNTTWFTNPQTVFAGGTEYQRVAVGTGAISVLVTHGDNTYTAGTEGTFRFQDEGGTNYFGFAKSESYTIGCNADAITVSDNVVTLSYDVIMGGDSYPIIYYTPSLVAPITWEQLNSSDGEPIAGATHSVTWGVVGTQYLAYLNVTGEPSGFFRAETEVAGDVIFETNMKASLEGGIVCPNTATGNSGVIRPSYNGSSVIWTWSAE